MNAILLGPKISSWRWHQKICQIPCSNQKLWTYFGSQKDQKFGGLRGCQFICKLAQTYISQIFQHQKIALRLLNCVRRLPNYMVFQYTNLYSAKWFFQPIFFTFSTLALILMHSKVLSRLSQPTLLHFIHWNILWHNSVFELCCGLIIFETFPTVVE